MKITPSRPPQRVLMGPGPFDGSAGLEAIGLKFMAADAERPAQLNSPDDVLVRMKTPVGHGIAVDAADRKLRLNHYNVPTGIGSHQS
ncbi:MAG: hypothetical protein WBQ69_12250 [Gallionella sp.]